MIYPYKGKIPDTLNDALSEVEDNKLIAIGSESSFFYIGDTDRFFRDLDFWETYYTNRADTYNTEKGITRRKSYTPAPFMPFLKRQVREMFYRHFSGEPDLLVILVEGHESGLLTFPKEYDDAKDKAEKTLKRIGRIRA